MAKWEVDSSFKDHGPRPGEIRAVNYIDGMGDDGNWVIKHRMEQFWDGTWAEIKVYHDPGNGKLERIKQ